MSRSLPLATSLVAAFGLACITAGSLSCSSLAVAGEGSVEPELPTRRGKDKLDVDYARDIHANTTDPTYLSEWVDHLPVSRRVSSPKQALGYSIGTPGELTQPETINAYFRTLADESPRVQVFSMGRSHGGREMIVAAIGSKKNLAKLDEIKAANRELADPRVTDEARARALAKDTPPIYWMTAGLHSPETGPPEMVMELAYRLAVSEQDHIKEIRDNVVVLITPVLEMDGRARMVDWYYRHLTGVTERRDSPPHMAPYWGDYTAHDNNRDGLQQSQPLTRNYTDTFHEFLPVLTLDLHESVPLLYVSTGTGPYNETIDPITVTEWQWIASYEVSTATKLGLQGVWTWGFYTGWYPGYILWVSNNHNATGRFYETFGNSSPKTFERELDDYSYAGARINSRQWYRAWPPDQTLTWSLRNNTNYMQTAVLSSLQLAARHGEELLFNFWQKGSNSLEAGKTERPHAFVIPAHADAASEAGATRRLLELLLLHRIELHQVQGLGEAGQTFRAAKGGEPVTVHDGDYLVRMDQPYRNYAKTLLQAQPFPASAKTTPYDDVAWSLDLMLDVEVLAIDDPAVLALDGAGEGSQLSPVADLDAVDDHLGAQTATPSGPGTRWLIEHRGQASLATLRWALPKAAKVRALSEAWQGHPAGSLIVEGLAGEELARHTAPLLLDALALEGEAPGEAATVEVNRPRVALFHTWRYTQDSGWARYTLEQLGVEFTLIDKDDLRAGGLADRFDLILVPSQGGMRFADIVHGVDTKWGPLAYTTTPEFPSHGVVDSSPDITGGMGFAGLGELEAFVRSGGTLVCLGSAGVLAADGGLAPGVRSLDPGGTPGSHLTTKRLRPDHPLAWGYEAVDWVFRGNLPVYAVRDWDWGRTVVQFGTKTHVDAQREADRKADIPAEPEALAELEGDAPAQPEAAEPTEPPSPSTGSAKAPLARSGIVTKPKAIERRAALLDVPVGDGRVLLFAWNPLHRHQNEHDFAYVTNALLFFDDMPDRAPSRDQMRTWEVPPDAGDSRD